VFALTITPQKGCSQNTQDSLQNVLKGDISDSVRVRTLLRLATENQTSGTNKSLPYAEEALEIATRINSPGLQARCYQRISYVYSVTGDFNNALKYDDLAIKAGITSKDSLQITTGDINLGDDYFNLGKYDEAYYYFTKAYKVSDAINDSLQMTISLYNVGKVFKELGQYDRALSHFRISERFSKQIHDKEGEAYILDEYGDIFLRTGNYDSALLMLSKSLKASRELKIEILEPKTLTKIARAHRKKKDFEKSIAYYDTAKLHNQKRNNK
jgi:tetratricopeptide (TPR) repeat protein